MVETLLSDFVFYIVGLIVLDNWVSLLVDGFLNVLVLVVGGFLEVFYGFFIGGIGSFGLFYLRGVSRFLRGCFYVVIFNGRSFFRLLIVDVYEGCVEEFFVSDDVVLGFFGFYSLVVFCLGYLG